MALRRGGNREGLNAWPGYVDALSTLLMVLIFVLLVFVLAQGFLSVALSSRDQALDRLNRQVSELADLLALERGQGEELRGRLGRMTEELRAATGARDTALTQLGTLQDQQERQGTERESLRADRDRLAARLADLEASSRGAAGRIASLEERLADALSRAEARGGDAAASVRDLTETRRALATERETLATARQQLAEQQARAGTAEGQRDRVTADLATTRQQLAEQQARAGTAEGQRDRVIADLATARAELDRTRQALEAMRQQMAALDRQVTTDRATIEARLSDITRLNEQVRALTALRDEMERRAQAALDRAGNQEQARTTAEAQARAEAERRTTAEAATGEQTRLAESARAQVALLTQQITALRAELSRIAAVLEAEENAGRDKEAQISALGQRLNAALAARVEELQRYRSDFFGRLRDVLGDRPEVRIVGDRFVFQSEVLFPVGSADLSASGTQQLRELSRVLLDVSRRFPPDLPWLLRVDGHADRSPLRGTGRYASNWELSSARAIAVAQVLISEGLPANRVGATAFGDNQPLDAGDSPEALARNRRIELRLTDR
jgi:chemotaxis protein MotB